MLRLSLWACWDMQTQALLSQSVSGPESKAPILPHSRQCQGQPPPASVIQETVDRGVMVTFKSPWT